MKQKNDKIDEGFKEWIKIFLLLTGLGLVPQNIKHSKDSNKKKFVESFSKDKIDAAKFIDFLNKNGDNNKTLKELWRDFIKDNKDINSNFKDIKKYIKKSNYNYIFDKKYINYDNIDIYNFKPTNYLTDLGDFIVDSLEKNINNFIKDYENKTTIEIAIITIPSLKGNEPFDYSLKQFRRLGIGKKNKNNGILLMLSKEERAWQIITGYGIEGLLPDIECYRIGNDIIKPYFSKGDYYNGLIKSLEEITKILNDNPEDIRKFKYEEDIKHKEQIKEIFTYIGISLLILLIISVISLIAYKEWKNAKEFIMVVNKLLKDIDTIMNELEDFNIKEIDDIKEELKNFIESNIDNYEIFKSNKESKKIINFILNKNKNLNFFKNYETTIKILYSKWKNLKEKLTKIKTEINLHNIKSIINSIEKGYKICNQLKDEYKLKINYGNVEDMKLKAKELDDIVQKINNLYKNSIKDAYKLLNIYKEKRDELLFDYINVYMKQRMYLEYEENIKKCKELINSALSKIEKYKKHGNIHEINDLNNSIALLYDNVNKYKNDKSKYEYLNAELYKILNKIKELEARWKYKENYHKSNPFNKGTSSYMDDDMDDDDMDDDDIDDESSTESSFPYIFGDGTTGGGGAGGFW